MTPWRRRLNDLRQLIRQADDTYFDPDLFRLNVNNAIQTARTVTFLIAKGKDSISNFENWHAQNVLSETADDPVMKWMKDARNTIEKEGDLDVLSDCSVELLYSYTDRGPRIALKDEGALFIGLKRLWRFTQSRFPTGIVKESALIIERRWVTSTLPEWEFTDALYYAYNKLKGIVDKLDKHIGAAAHPVTELRHPTVGSLSRRGYLKAGELKVSTFEYVSTEREIDVASLAAKYDLERLKGVFEPLGKFRETFKRLQDLARYFFERDGTHIAMGVYFDSEENPFQFIPLTFADRIEKLIFWTELGHQARISPGFAGVYFVSELWIRSLKGYPTKAVSELDIQGEALQFVGLTKRGTYILETFEILKGEDGPHLTRNPAPTQSESFPNFLVPLAKAWGLVDLVKKSQGNLGDS